MQKAAVAILGRGAPPEGGAVVSIKVKALVGLMDLSDSLLHLSTPLISTGPGRYTGVEDCPRVALPRAIVGSDTPIFYLRVGDSVFCQS